METVFTGKLKPFLDAVVEEMELYVPKKTGEHYTYIKYDAEAKAAVEFNNIRTCVPVKEFLFPLRELAATFSESVDEKEIRPFAVFGLKNCDLRSIEILDKVFLEEGFKDPFYAALRKNMFIISGDCFEPGESCFCNIFGGKSFTESGFDLNVAKLDDGFVIEAGSDEGDEFIKGHSHFFSEAPETVLSKRAENRERTQSQLEKQNADFSFEHGAVKAILENNDTSEIFDAEAKNCIECQACTRVCPTCHCFYLYDTRQKDYFAKMKMWDSCMRYSYASVAGGANPHKILGDRMKHRLLHKFVYFLDRYGVNMCVGCGRCVDADAGGMDLREILKKLGKKSKDEDKEEAKVAK